MKDNDNQSDNQNNITWHPASITRQHREALNQHKSMNLWFTGLSASGKSTLAHAVEKKLHNSEGTAPMFLMETMSVTGFVEILVF